MSPPLPSTSPRWRVWIDTGGTFTDCLARAPDGRLHRAKVLSSSALRGRVRERRGAAELAVEVGWRVPAEFFRGCDFHLLGPFPDHPSAAEPEGAGIPVAGFEPEAGILRLAAPPGAGMEVVAGAGFEIRSPEEAPVLAARLVTGTPMGRPLPPLALRLATTRGTNALLERRGAPVALFLTRGFGDLLLIGTQQRPDLFALEIRKPEPLYRAVVEVEERLAADGTVLRPWDPDADPELGRRLAELRAAGVSSAAVALFHAYRQPRHEERLGEHLRRAGFEHVTLSSRAAPLIGYLARAETAVVDAYLAPVVRGYLERVEGALPAGASLHVMTSAGGLARADLFQPKDSLLSGPAGGVVGAARAGRRSGFRNLIAFDMGGTSTDVARYGGDFDYDFEHRVGDARLMAPALAIESVAAGGGSVCAWRDGRLTVGPRSAGAHPGPACYGAGGPLTLTDVNLLLGRLDAGRFEIPIDPDAARAAFDELRRAVAAGGGAVPSPEELLAGLLRIADERMAGAIRAISVARGYDPAEHALVAFGGAGPQHACAVAGVLGMRTVLVPADAGLLSAAGLGAAVVERFAQRQVLRPLAEVEGELTAWLDELARQAIEAVVAEGVERAEVEARRRRMHLRLAGQDSTLEVEHRPDEEVARAFARAYREIYGYPPGDRPVEVESLRAVASARPPVEPRGTTPAAARAATPAGERRVCFAGTWHAAAAVYERAGLAPGARLAGPALVFERHSATAVPPGWAGRVDGAGGLILERPTPAASS